MAVQVELPVLVHDLAYVSLFHKLLRIVVESSDNMSDLDLFATSGM